MYEGKFENDMKNDKNCEIKFKSGAHYKGAVLDGKYHGEGQLVQRDGDSYEGEFEEGKKHGFGILKSKDFIFKGYFKNDLKEGKGEL